ncbi:MAG TPA: VCBS repeat-containing protein [Solirubrobacteraceae bacterium]|nr:VCBS repeat-containing protein [Solirubrobacteraceae bacterium]
MRARMTAAALAAALLLVGAASAWAAFVKEGSPYTVGDDPLSLNAGDFNGDGRPDVATINGTSSDVSVFLRAAGGGFAQEPGSPISVGAGSGPSGAAVGDYNGDGRTDLAVSRFVAGGISVLLRQPGGGFALEGGAAVLSGTSIHAVAAGDFNGDGRLDLAATLAAGQLVILLRNAANTGFDQSPQAFATGSAPVAIAVGDFNGDGLADLATANRSSDNATILLRVPGGTFSAEATLPVGDNPVGIVAADFDGNGRADLAVVDYVPGTVAVFLRNGANSGFTAQPPITVNATPAGIDAADFDRDGRPDLAVASNAGAVDILRRNAAGGFTRDPAIAIAGAVNDVAAADFDGDSRPDLAASSYYTDATPDTFSVLLNPAPAPPPGPTPAPPVAGKSVNVEPVSGTVKIKRPGRKRFVTLTGEAQIPVGSSIDTRRGRITITAAQGSGTTASADFYQGLFKLTQAKRSKLTTLRLIERLSCSRKPASAAAAKKKKRRLWGDGKGRFRTKGKHSAATVVGTKWLVQDRCTSTLTRVVRGKVRVRDFAKKKTVIVRAGKRYTARAKRR